MGLMYKKYYKYIQKYSGSLDFTGFFLFPFPSPFLSVPFKTGMCISCLCLQIQ